MEENRQPKKILTWALWKKTEKKRAQDGMKSKESKDAHCKRVDSD